MNCKQAETLVAAYIDGEVDALRNYSIKKHLLGCAGCTARQHSILALRARIRAEVPYFVAPPACATLKPRTVRSSGVAARDVSGRTKTSIVCWR